MAFQAQQADVVERDRIVMLGGALKQASGLSGSLRQTRSFQVHERKRDLRPYMILFGRLAVPDRRRLKISRNAFALIVDVAKREFSRSAVLLGRDQIPSERRLEILLAADPFAIHIAKDCLSFCFASFRRGRYPLEGNADIPLNARSIRKYELVNSRRFVAHSNGGGPAPCFVTIWPERRLVPMKIDQTELELRFDVAKLSPPFIPDDGIGNASDDTLASHIEHPYSIARPGIARL